MDGVRQLLPKLKAPGPQDLFPAPPHSPREGQAAFPRDAQKVQDSCGAARFTMGVSLEGEISMWIPHLWREYFCIWVD